MTAANLTSRGVADIMELTSAQKTLVNGLIQKGNALLNRQYVPILFTEEEEIDKELNNLKDHPHLFVLACVMDRQITAKKAWSIPHKISQEVGSLEFNSLLKLTQDDLITTFDKLRLHRFNESMARYFYLAVNKIKTDYEGDASRIWAKTPSSATVVRRFLEFQGIGIKIATMAANILARDFKIPMADHSSIDISPDVRVLRFFKENGLVPKDASVEEVIYLARELYPNYPGVLDIGAWESGKARSKS